jgi:hypothetical protein
MSLVQFEHGVANYEAWKQRFDRDPLGRQQSGARRVRVARPVDQSNHVVVEVDFATAAEAEAFLRRLDTLFELNPSTILHPVSRIVEVVETREY